MAYLTDQNIWRALVVVLRSNAPFKAALIGGIHEAFAIEKTPYPFLIYTPVASPNEDDWTSRMIVAVFDAVIFSKSSVVASNLDQSAANVLEGASFSVDGQATLIIRRLGSIRTADSDEEGKKVYGIGGSYEIWTDQHPT